jgi:hypothetical protein
MAVLQIDNPLGLTLILSFAVPEYAFSLATATTFLISAAALQMLTLAVVGAMVNAPVAHVCVFIAYTFVTTYLIYGLPRLGRLWVWVQIPTVTAFYMVLFDYRGLGWDNSQMFAGMVVAVLILWLFNNVIWAEPAAAVLQESLRETLERSRGRLKLLVAIFLAEDGAVPDRDRAVASKLAYHLTLLEPSTRNAKSVHESATLLATVMAAERIHNEIDRLRVPACMQLGAALDETATRHLHEAANALDAALEAYIARRFDSIPEELRAGLEKLHSAQAATVESIALASIARHFDNIAALIAGEHDDLPPEPAAPFAHPVPQRAFGLSHFLLRFCTRHTIAMTLAFVCGLFDNNAAIHAALWLLMIGGPPSHGATAKKFTMRAIGATGALVFAAIATLVLAPNFVTLPPYMFEIFAGVALMTYVGGGGGELQYLAIGGTAFVIAFSAPGPRPEIVGSIWTIWGISLGMILRALVSATWPEHTNRTLAEGFERPLAALVMLASGRQTHDLNEIEAAEMVIVVGIQQMLTVAAEARLQGRTTGIDAPNLVHALDTMRRLAFAVRNRVPGQQDGFDHVLCAQLESWLQSLRSQLEPGQLSIAPLRTMVSSAPRIELETGASGDPARAHAADLILTLESQLSSISLADTPFVAET